jgi:hypothetical protein
MLWAQIAVTLASLAICTFVPGFLLVRRLPWRPLEKLCGAVAASLILLYVLGWAVFCFAPGLETGIFRGVACLFAALAIWQWRGIHRLARAFGARQALTGFGFLLVWSLPALAMVRVFSGAGWGCDWIEHFQRTLFFLHHLPTNIAIAGGYILPARPPMMNLLGAFFLAQTTDLYEIHQVIFTFLNLLAFLPCCLMLRALLKSRKARYLPLTVLFALNPMMMENAWYPWTKLLAVFYVVFALWLYLAGLRKNDSLRIVSAFLCLAAGLLVHYSAGPYLVFVAGHYLLRAFAARPHRIRELAAIGVSSALLLAIWFGWSIKAYGIHDTFASNTRSLIRSGIRAVPPERSRATCWQPFSQRSFTTPSHLECSTSRTNGAHSATTPLCSTKPTSSSAWDWLGDLSFSGCSIEPSAAPEAVVESVASGWHSSPS